MSSNDNLIVCADNNGKISDLFKVSPENIVGGDGVVDISASGINLVSSKISLSSNNENDIGRKAWYFYDYDLFEADNETLYSAGDYIYLSTFTIWMTNKTSGANEYANLCSNTTEGTAKISYADYKKIANHFKKTYANAELDGLVITNITFPDTIPSKTEFSVEITINDGTKVLFKVQTATPAKYNNIKNKFLNRDTSKNMYFRTLELYNATQYKQVRLYLSDKQIKQISDYKNTSYQISDNEKLLESLVGDTDNKIQLPAGADMTLIANIHYDSAFTYVSCSDSIDSRLYIDVELKDPIQNNVYTIFETGITDPDGVIRRYSIFFTEYPQYGFSEICEFAAQIGVSSIVAGNYGFCAGGFNAVYDTYGIALGSSNKAKAYASIALGNNTISSEQGQCSVGRYNTEIDDAAFIIGNGSNNSTRSNALSVSWDGVITVPVFNKSTDGEYTATGTTAKLRVVKLDDDTLSLVLE